MMKCIDNSNTFIATFKPYGRRVMGFIRYLKKPEYDLDNQWMFDVKLLPNGKAFVVGHGTKKRYYFSLSKATND